MAEGSVSLKKTDPDKERKEALLETARKRFAEAAEGWRDVFDEARKDLAFLAGDQWDPKTKLDRETANRPALVINKLPTFWQQVANEARQNKPAVRVSPIGGGRHRRPGQGAAGHRAAHRIRQRCGCGVQHGL
jgi:hypothetical protein